jgi:DNA-binding transcriptional MerR regulator
MSDCGVNLAGVEVALKLMQQMKEMQQQLEEMERKINKVAEAEIEDIIEDIIEDAEWKEV